MDIYKTFAVNIFHLLFLQYPPMDHVLLVITQTWWPQVRGRRRPDLWIKRLFLWVNSLYHHGPIHYVHITLATVSNVGILLYLCFYVSRTDLHRIVITASARINLCWVSLRASVVVYSERPLQTTNKKFSDELIMIYNMNYDRPKAFCTSTGGQL